MTDPIVEYNMAVAGKCDRWVPGAGGTEPVSTIEGRRLQWCYNPKLHKHAYYDLDNDLILTDGLEYLLPKCFTGGI
jgi:hypothetical protein